MSPELKKQMKEMAHRYSIRPIDRKTNGPVPQLALAYEAGFTVAVELLEKENQERKERNTILAEGSKELLSSKAEMYHVVLSENVELRASLAIAKKERLAYEKLANEWMQDYDKLKAKYEPSMLVIDD